MGGCNRANCLCCAPDHIPRHVGGIHSLLRGYSDLSGGRDAFDDFDRYSRSRDYGHASLRPSYFSADLICSECDRRELSNSKLGQSVMSLGWVCDDPQCSYFDIDLLQNRSPRIGNPLYNRDLRGDLGGSLGDNLGGLGGLEGLGGLGGIGGLGNLGNLGNLGQILGRGGRMNNPRDVFTGLGGFGRGLNARVRGIGNRPMSPALTGLDGRRIRSPFRLR